jgi:hypothetical protein
MRKILLTLVVITFSNIAFAQVKVRPGVKLGINQADLSNMDGSSKKTGLNGGLFVNLKLAGFYQLQVETTYSNQGTTFISSSYATDFNDASFSRNEKIDFDLKYISIGIANKFFPAKDVGFNFIVGPSIDILVNDEDFYDYYTPIDLSFFGGVGYEFSFGLGLEIRYKQGVVDIREDYYDYYDEDYDDTILNGLIQIGATYKFGL